MSDIVILLSSIGGVFVMYLFSKGGGAEEGGIC